MFLKSVFAVGLVALQVPAAVAAVTLFSDNGNANYEIDFGPNRGTLITNSNFTGEFGTLDPNNINSSIGGLSVSWSLSGSGTSLVTLDFELQNTSATSTYNGLSYSVYVDPIGDYLDFGSQESGSANFPAPGAAPEPDAWELDDNISGNIAAHFDSPAPLDNSDACGIACDLAMALSWDLGSLSPGEVLFISVGFSDDGQSLSSRYLDAVAVGDSATSLRLSGTAAVVPLPASLPLLGAGLLALVGVTRRRRPA